jgi:hypothetical protein
LSGFCCWKFKKIAKIGFGRKNQLTHVFTLGPIAQAITTIYGTATFATESPLNTLTSVFPFHQFSDVAKG